MYSDTRLTIQEIDHLKGGAQLNESVALVYRTQSVTLKTEARVSAAELSAEIPVVGEAMPQPGSMVIFEATNEDGIFVKVFVGFVFSYSVTRFGVVSLTAYDAIRYLQNPATGKWVGKEGKDISEIVRDVVRSCGLETMAREMKAEFVGVKPIRLIKIAESGINVIDEILEWAQLKATANENGVTTKGGKTYAATRPANRWMFIDNCGTLTLCTSNHLAEVVMGAKEPPVIGTGCAITDMNLEVSINESANSVWLLRATDYGMYGWKAEDADCVKKWGPLVYYEKIDNAYCRNNEQMQLRAAIELCTRDCEKRSVNISTLGITGLRAGMVVRLNIPWLEKYFGEVSKSKLVFLDSVDHTWEEGTHTMNLKADALPGDVDLELWEKLAGPLNRSKGKGTTKGSTKSTSKTNSASETQNNNGNVVGALSGKINDVNEAINKLKEKTQGWSNYPDKKDFQDLKTSEAVADTGIDFA